MSTLLTAGRDLDLGVLGMGLPERGRVNVMPPLRLGEGRSLQRLLPAKIPGQALAAAFLQPLHEESGSAKKVVHSLAETGYKIGKVA
jgi:hypothetical protein